MFTTAATLTLSTLDAGAAERHAPALGELLCACVQDGASIGFVLPYGPADGEAYWRERVLPGVRAGEVTLLAAWRDGRLTGTVQLGCDTMPNQRHRADVRKLLVHPACRRQGVARALMGELERLARLAGRTLLTLDTRTGDTAEPLYASLGYQTAGVIPQYARDAASDRLDATTFMYKILVC